MVLEELPEHRGITGAYAGSLRKIHYRSCPPAAMSSVTVVTSGRRWELARGRRSLKIDGAPASSRARDRLVRCRAFERFHSHATELINAGVSIEAVRRRLGHASQLYALLDDKVADDEIRAVRPRARARG
jgi:hypothetical protein